MDDIRFVLEAPQNTRTHKKRPRLVTSCDNCRLKKIKCIQSAPNTLCEACSTARLQCRFRDRERYFAERSRLVSNNAKTPAADKHRIDMIMKTDTSPPPAPTHTSTHRSNNIARTPPKRSSAYHPYHSSVVHSARSSISPMCTPPPPPPPPPPSPLFDPGLPDRPRSQLMMPLINAFFDNLSVCFPFLAFDETIKRFLTRDLPLLLANCIAAIAVQYVGIPDVLEWGIARATDEYSIVAKSLANSAVATTVDLDTLHSLILLAWVEYNRQRHTEFCHYGQLAVHMSRSLGLGNEHAIHMGGHTEYERTVLKNTQMCVAFLEATMQSQSCS